MQPAIRIEGISKQYRLGATGGGAYRTLRESVSDSAVATWKRLSRLARSKGAHPGSNGRAANGHISLATQDKPNTFWALNDVSFDVQPGEVIGIIGRNGAGKSTLLKILSRITEPTRGRITLNGRVASLLEVGTGFHPELTGRENIFLNGSILGMTRREIQRRFDEIVDFSGVEKFLETPVKRYSSGMYVRLAFAVAAHLEPEILVVDEVLAVGDSAFQAKCLRKMHDVAISGRTVLLVSHNMAAIENLCSSAVCLSSGQVIMVGSARQAIASYMESGRPASSGICRRTKNSIIQDVRVWDETNNIPGVVSSGSDIRIDVVYSAPKSFPESRIGIRIDSISGARLAHLQSEIMTGGLLDLPATGTVSCSIHRFPLLPGTYSVVVAMFSKSNTIDIVEPGVELMVEHGDFFGTGKLPSSSLATFLIPSKWKVEGCGGATKQDEHTQVS